MLRLHIGAEGEELMLLEAQRRFAHVQLGHGSGGLGGGGCCCCLMMMMIVRRHGC